MSDKGGGCALKNNFPMQQLKRALFSTFVLVYLLAGSTGQDDDFLYDYFPDGFLWGTATSTYQIEGGWDADGKGVQIWDTWTQAGNSLNNDTGDIACDSYNKVQEDVAILTGLGVDFYRFSLSWSRMIPLGEGAVNPAGVAYYNLLIDSLLAAGIEPMVTLYHWDLPQALQDNYGGWESEELVPLFTEYARVCYESFGDRVKWWLTFNEPWVTTTLGYDIAVNAPGVFHPGTGAYKTAHTILKSHAEAWHLYDQQFRATQQGQVSITLDSDWKEPFTASAEDIEAAERAIQFKLGWYANPIYVNGDYPEMMKAQVAYKSESQGFNESRLPSFTEEEKLRILGTWDYFGLNHYTSQLIANGPNDLETTDYFSDQEVTEHRDPSWPTSGSEWLRMVPWGLRKLLNFIKDRYGNPPVIITENGVSDRNSSIQDDHRINFYSHYINNALKATLLDGCNLTAYTAWSLMDNFEWGAGYVEKFGLHYVGASQKRVLQRYLSGSSTIMMIGPDLPDYAFRTPLQRYYVQSLVNMKDFDDPERPRTRKASADFFTQLIQDNGFPPPNSTHF